MTTTRRITACVLLAALCVLGACKDRTVSVSPDAHVRVTDLRDGIGSKAEEGALVHVHYTGMLDDGTVVVDTYDLGRVHKFVVGGGTVIPGMDKGVIGMRSGGKRRLVMPPQAHYGRYGYADAIPANTTMTFEVEMLRVIPTGSRGDLHPNDPRTRTFGQRRR
ncbi:MAG: FKBP-type peptidyl-prolyl cis-trans isomerase [Planctomycetota bacterium]